jgi:hypothetical protein
MEVNQHILSVGKDGKMLVQDLRNAYFPRRHISACVTAISSRGDVAYQRAKIERVRFIVKLGSYFNVPPLSLLQDDILGMTAGTHTAVTPLWFADKPAFFGSKFRDFDGEAFIRLRRGHSSKRENLAADGTGHQHDSHGQFQGNVRNGAEQPMSFSQSLSQLFFPMDTATKPLASSAAPGNTMVLKDPSVLLPSRIQNQLLENYIDACDPISSNGTIFVGKAVISTLIDAKEINRDHAAEGGVFDPATIKLLAVSYHIRGGITACAENVRIAKSAGLLCRAAVWSTLHALLRYQPKVPSHLPVFIEPLNLSNTVSSASTAGPPSPAPAPPLRLASASSVSSLSTLNQSVNQDNISNLGTGTSALMDTVTPSCNFSFGASLIGDLLQDLINCGDCLHFVSVCELVAEASSELLASSLESAEITAARQHEAYYSYISLLQKLRLFSEANNISKNSKIRHPAVASVGMSLHMYCESCGKEVPDSGRISYCQKCNKGSGLCVVCNLPVRGLFRWCQICSHGGHNDCLSKWFRQSPCCASGCGHNCTSELYCKEVSSSISISSVRKVSGRIPKSSQRQSRKKI